MVIEVIIWLPGLLLEMAVWLHTNLTFEAGFLGWLILKRDFLGRNVESGCGQEFYFYIQFGHCPFVYSVSRQFISSFASFFPPFNQCFWLLQSMLCSGTLNHHCDRVENPTTSSYLKSNFSPGLLWYHTWLVSLLSNCYFSQFSVFWSIFYWISKFHND